MTQTPQQQVAPPLDGTAARGRLVMLAILALVVVVPLVNLQSLLNDGLPAGLRAGMAHFTYTVGMAASILLVVLWYFAWAGCRRAGMALGGLYLAAATIGILVPLLGAAGGSELRVGWPLSMALVSIYGFGGWSLLTSSAIRQFQAHQRAMRLLAGR